MKKWKDNNYITVQGWMVNRLGLSGNELLCFALIYGFCQDGESEFKGSLAYIGEALSVTRQNARVVLLRLVEKGVLTKRDNEINGVKFCCYGVAETDTGCVENSNGGVAETATGVIETATNNTIYNTKYKTDYIEQSIYPLYAKDDFATISEISPEKEQEVSTVLKPEKVQKRAHTRTKDEASEELPWINSYEIYLQELDNGVNDILKDIEWIKQREEFYPNIDVPASIRKSVIDFWATERGWLNKKSTARGRKPNKICWKSTFTNALSMSSNRVYKKREFGSFKVDEQSPKTVKYDI